MPNPDPYGDRMTARDPYSDRVSDQDPYSRRATRVGDWSIGAVIATVVVFVVVVAAIGYAVNNNQPTTASGPHATTSAPSTTGQGDATRPRTAR